MLLTLILVCGGVSGIRNDCSIATSVNLLQSYALYKHALDGSALPTQVKETCPFAPSESSSEWPS
uniref:Uncharacterized protein n=1 Tax=Aegilops tauschii subsp. strangulata TaxID=200361 RepID=A0A453A6M9_AEGTS